MIRSFNALVLLVVAVALVACAGGGPGFQQVASSTGSELFAAATTVEYAHTGRLPVAFARSAFDGYRSSLQDAERQLRTAAGAPGGGRLEALLAVYRPAWRAVQQPCLQGGCDWRGQVRALREAGDALDRASGT
jgi:hypothetical protein